MCIVCILSDDPRGIGFDTGLQHIGAADFLGLEELLGGGDSLCADAD